MNCSCGSVWSSLLSILLGNDIGTGTLLTGIDLGERADQHRLTRHVTFTASDLPNNESLLCTGKGAASEEGQAGIVTKVECISVESTCAFPVQLFLYGLVNTAKYSPLRTDPDRAIDEAGEMYNVEQDVAEAVLLGITVEDTYDALIVKYRIVDGAEMIAVEPQTPVVRYLQRTEEQSLKAIYGSNGLMAYEISREHVIAAIEHISQISASIQVNDLSVITATIEGEHGEASSEGTFECTLALTVIPFPMDAVSL